MEKCDECYWKAKDGCCLLSTSGWFYCRNNKYCNFKEKENSNVAEPNRYNVLADVRAVVTEMLLPNISPDKFPGEGSVMNALRNSYIDTYNNTIRDVIKKLSEHFS
jgi:hypothetical protein